MQLMIQQIYQIKFKLIILVFLMLDNNFNKNIKRKSSNIKYKINEIFIMITLLLLMNKLIYILIMFNCYELYIIFIKNSPFFILNLL